MPASKHPRDRRGEPFPAARNITWFCCDTLVTLAQHLSPWRVLRWKQTSPDYVDIQSGQLTVVLKFGELSGGDPWDGSFLPLPGHPGVVSGKGAGKPATKWNSRALWTFSKRVDLYAFLRRRCPPIPVPTDSLSFASHRPTVDNHRGRIRYNPVTPRSSRGNQPRMKALFKLRAGGFTTVLSPGRRRPPAPNMQFIDLASVRGHHPFRPRRVGRSQTPAASPRWRLPTRRKLNRTNDNGTHARQRTRQLLAPSSGRSVRPECSGRDDLWTSQRCRGYAGIDRCPLSVLTWHWALVPNLLSECNFSNHVPPLFAPLVSFSVSGAYLELPYADPERFGEKTLPPELDAIRTVFDSLKSLVLCPAPRPTLAALVCLRFRAPIFRRQPTRFGKLEKNPAKADKR